MQHLFPSDPHLLRTTEISADKNKKILMFIYDPVTYSKEGFQGLYYILYVEMHTQQTCIHMKTGVISKLHCYDPLNTYFSFIIDTDEML